MPNIDGGKNWPLRIDSGLDNLIFFGDFDKIL
jgi:hypothetical protein